MKTRWSIAALCVLAAGCREQSRDQTVAPEQDRRGQPAQPVTAQPQQPGAAPPAGPAQGTLPADTRAGAYVSCRPGAEVEETASRLIEMADANGDGRVSKDEAQATTSFLVGGFFFRADADGNGVVMPEEGRQARVDFMSQHPAVASLFRTVRTATGQSPFATVARLVDVEYGKPLAIAEARDAVRTAVNDLYSVADGDKDGVITAAEARTAAWEGARSVGRAAFQAADSDRSGGLSQDELQAALRASASAAFKMSDANGDGQLTEDEAAVAMGRLGRMAGIQAPASP
jgi:hypothetical protein